MTESEVIPVNYTAPKDLVDEFDATWKRRHFENRSEAIRRLMRDFVEKYKEA